LVNIINTWPLKCKNIFKRNVTDVLHFFQKIFDLCSSPPFRLRD
jgi:hypothetical protein